MRPKFRQLLFRAFVASVIADVIGSELIGLFLTGATWNESEAGRSAWLLALMVVGAPLLGAIWVVPFGTVVATCLSPLAVRVSLTKTPLGLLYLMALGALVGFVLLFLVGLAIALYFQVGPPETPLGDALLLSRIYGPLFGGLTAAGWWWQLPKPGYSPIPAVNA